MEQNKMRKIFEELEKLAEESNAIPKEIAAFGAPSECMALAYDGVQKEADKIVTSVGWKAFQYWLNHRAGLTEKEVYESSVAMFIPDWVYDELEAERLAQFS